MIQSSYNASSRICCSASSMPTSPATSALNPSNPPPGYRNGYKPHRLNTRVGNLELLIPQDRDGGTELFERYQRNEKALVLSLMTTYLQGVSTRNLSTETLGPASFSKSLVSESTHDLDVDLEAWRGDYPYLTVDARYERVRVGHQPGRADRYWIKEMDTAARPGGMSQNREPPRRGG